VEGAYMISRRVPGKEATHHPERLAILEQLGRCAALINSITTTGFGGMFDLDSDRLARYATWNEYLSDELDLEARLAILGNSRVVTATKIRKIRAALRRGSSLAPALNHGDLRLKNVIVDDRGRIAAVLDWEHCTSSIAPHWDLSVALHDLSIDEKHGFLDGYGMPPEEWIAAAPLVKALNLINYAPQIERIGKRGDNARLEQYRMRLGGALDFYSL
jgi:hygromycin-B 4-O-kinase